MIFAGQEYGTGSSRDWAAKGTNLLGLDDTLKPMSEVTLIIHRADGTKTEQPLRSRVDTAIEVEYIRHGGILPFVLRQLVAQA